MSMWRYSTADIWTWKAGWDPALITNVEKGVLVGSRLYIDPSEGHSGEAVVSYYMNDQKTVIGQVHVSADNLYSPQAVTGLTVTKRTTRLTDLQVEPGHRYL